MAPSEILRCRCCGCAFHGSFDENGAFVYSDSLYERVDAQRAALSDEEFLKWIETRIREKNPTFLRREAIRLARMGGDEAFAASIERSVLDRLKLDRAADWHRAASVMSLR